MKQILHGLLIFLIIAPVVCAETCDIRIEIGEEGTCGNYKIRQDSFDAGDRTSLQIAHFRLWRLSPYAYLGSSSLDFLRETGGKYYDDNKLHVVYTGHGHDPNRAKYTLEDLSPQLVVKGNLKYKDRKLNWAPAKWATVHIVEHDPGIGDDDRLGSALTDETGYFEFGPVKNVDSDDDGGKLDIIVQFVAESEVGCVRDANDGIYGLVKGPYPNESGELCMSWFTPDNETQYKAWWVYDTLYDGWKYLSDTVGYDMTGVTVYWQWEHDADFGCGYDGTHAHGNGFGSTEPCIHLDGETGDDGGHANDPDVIIHEYGHCVMYKVFGDYRPPIDCSQGHQMDGISEPGCAWSEGWASFMPLAVFDDEYFTDNTYGHGSRNLETRDDGSFPDGDSCEGNVAAALWDIYDDHDEIYDRLSDGFGNIWHVLHDQTTDEDNFSDFYDSWCELGYDKQRANSAIFQNDIDYNLPPGVVVTNPEPGKVYFGIIHTLTYTTDEDGDVPQVEIWVSRDNIEWHLLDLPLKSDVESDGYSACGEEEFWHVDWDTTHEIDEDDSVWLRVYATDNLGASSSDNTDGSFIVDNVAPHHWRDFSPTDWVADQTPDCTIEVKDNTAGLDVSTACYKYSTDGDSSWSGWRSASCTGSDGTTSYQTITADSVPFNRDSGTQNKIKFRIDDVARNTGESEEYTVLVDAADPSAPVISSLTHPEGDEWYTCNDPSFVWTTPYDTSGISCYSYTFDQSATTTPDMTCEPAGNSGSYTDIADGVWCFHVRAKDNAGNWGGADHYMLKIEGEASTTDAVIALVIAAGSREYDSRWDVSGDGQVTSLDALMILQAAGGKP
jgi:hypothetical protein